MLRGDYQAGWEGYQWRWKAGLCVPRNFTAPLGKASRLPANQFWCMPSKDWATRCTSFVMQSESRSSARVVFECPGELFALLNGVGGVDLAVVQGEPLPEFDLHVPLMSLPRLLGVEVGTIDADVPYIRCDAPRKERWREKLSGYRDLKVGVAWRGNPKHKRDHLRSFSPEFLAAIASVPHVQLFSLQKPIGLDEMPIFNSNRQPIDLAPELTDFAETAAAIQNLDLLISAIRRRFIWPGRSARTVWVALPYVPDCAGCWIVMIPPGIQTPACSANVNAVVGPTCSPTWLWSWPRSLPGGSSAMDADVFRSIQSTQFFRQSFVHLPTVDRAKSIADAWIVSDLPIFWTAKILPKLSIATLHCEAVVSVASLPTAFSEFVPAES